MRKRAAGAYNQMIAAFLCRKFAVPFSRVCANIAIELLLAGLPASGANLILVATVPDALSEKTHPLFSSCGPSVSNPCCTSVMDPVLVRQHDTPTT
jgi:hypothetical protein